MAAVLKTQASQIDGWQRVEVSGLSLRVWGKQKVNEEAETESNEILSSILWGQRVVLSALDPG